MEENKGKTAGKNDSKGKRGFRTRGMNKAFYFNRAIEAMIEVEAMKATLKDVFDIDNTLIKSALDVRKSDIQNKIKDYSIFFGKTVEDSKGISPEYQKILDSLK